ncbi:MAG: cation:proton antiporter domain-containing protein, partial [Phycisphaerales bacterium]
LEVNGKRLKELMGIGLATGILQVVVTGIIGYIVARLFQAPVNASIVIGAISALSSTAVVSRVLQDRSEFDAPFGRAAFSILLVQDLAIVPLMLLIAFIQESPEASEMASELGIAGVKLIALFAVLFLVGVLILPR